MPDWRSGSAALLHSDGHKFESCIGHFPFGGLLLLSFIMANRLMSDRDHLEALIHSAQALLQAGTASPVEVLALKVRLSKAVSRAKQDVYPQG